MNGILLEILNTRPDAIEGFIETDSASMNASGISLDQLNGMLFLTESGSFLEPNGMTCLSVQKISGK